MELTMENKLIAIEETRNVTTTKITFARANPKSDYIRILDMCAVRPVTLQEIYPNVKSPLAMEVVALAKQGYLQKFSTPKHIHCKNSSNGIHYNTYSKVWYGITSRGLFMLNGFKHKFNNVSSELPF
jgi:hypothetical protein